MKADLQTHKTHGNKSASFFGKSEASTAFFQPAIIQPQLTINEPGDQYEQEADAMAERVMRMETAGGVPTDEEQPIQTMPLAISRLQRQESEVEEPVQMMPLSIQRKCAACEQEEQVQRQELPEEEAIQTEPLSIQRQQASQKEEMVQTMPLAIQRKCAECEQEEQVQTMPLMRKSQNGGYQATPKLTSQLFQSKSGGSSLPRPTLNYMNQAFGTDFSQVRVHTGSQAQEMSQGIQAKAFTHGSDIYFNRGQYRPESSDGKRLLAHELTHVVQQKQTSKIQRLSVTQYKKVKGTCGERNVQWVFSLDNNAPEDGYIVQQVDKYEFVSNCPNIAIGPPAPIHTFWEAWFVKKGDKIDWTTVRDKWTDGNTRPSRTSTNGSDIAAGTIKFFKKRVTGDLGDFGTAPADPKSPWGPGKVPNSGALPSTPSKPSWWSNTPTEGPSQREVWASWDCCDADKSKHTYDLKTIP